MKASISPNMHVTSALCWWWCSCCYIGSSKLTGCKDQTNAYVCMPDGPQCLISVTCVWNMLTEVFLLINIRHTLDKHVDSALPLTPPWSNLNVTTQTLQKDSTGHATLPSSVYQKLNGMFHLFHSTNITALQDAHHRPPSSLHCSSTPFPLGLH